MAERKGLFAGMIQLPEELFKNEHSRKSILLLQNHGGTSKQAEEVLLVKASLTERTKNITNF